MNDNWEEKLKSFVNKAGDELKRAGIEIRAEAEKLITEVKDPERQRKVKEGLKDFGDWAKQTAEEFGQMVEQGVKKAEVAFRQNAPSPKAKSAASKKKKSAKKAAGKKKAAS